jgi:hypothetical protein
MEEYPSCKSGIPPMIQIITSGPGGGLLSSQEGDLN